MEIKKVRGIAKSEAKRAVKGHEASMHGTKKMAKGGKTNLQMKQLG